MAEATLVGMTERTALPDLDAPPVVELTEEDDDPEAAHIVTQRDLIHSQITGQPIRALCGKLWVPKRNPDDYPMCQACVEMLNALGPPPA
jgi:hypothetical protein